MAKIDQVEELKNLLHDIAENVSLQRFTEQSAPSKDQTKCNCYQYLFSQLKNEISKNLGIIDAYFQSSSEFFDFELCDAILAEMNTLSYVTSQVLDRVSNFGMPAEDEEGGISNA